MKKMFFLFGIIAIISFTSCSIDPCGNDKVQFLDNYNSLLEEVDDLDLDYSDERWEEYDNKFKKNGGRML